MEVVILGMFMVALLDPKFREGGGRMGEKTDGLPGREEKKGGGWVGSLMGKVNSRRDVFG